ncbi:hypothetical protein GCM10022209_06610 [Chitinophaga oryziterrae]
MSEFLLKFTENPVVKIPYMILKSITFFLVAIFVANVSFAQSKADIIKSIKKEFKDINDDNSFKKVVLENEEFMEHMTDRGGSLTGYYKDEKLCKIVEWIGISNGIYISEYYFKEEQLIFVYKAFKAVVYDIKKGEVDYDQTGVKFEGRYYFNDKTLIDSITTGTNPFKTEPKDFPAEIEQDQQLLAKKKK